MPSENNLVIARNANCEMKECGQIQKIQSCATIHILQEQFRAENCVVVKSGVNISLMLAKCIGERVFRYVHITSTHINSNAWLACKSGFRHTSAIYCRLSLKKILISL